MHRPSLAALLVAVLAGCVATPADDAPRDDVSAAPGGDVDFPAIRFETSHGAFTAILYEDRAPKTVAFMQKLVASGYYDGREFNRVIPGFVIQEVDRAGGATDQKETIPLEAGTDAYFSMGALGVARNAEPDSGGSEFFVMDFAHSHLWPNYTVWGQVVEGMDVIHEIARVDALSTRPQGLPVPPPADLPLHDRIAVVPGKIAKASLTNVTLPAEVAARYPVVVGNRTVVEATRYTPEWPRDLAAGRESRLTWFVYTLPDDPPPNLEGATPHVAGEGVDEDLAFTPDPADGRILHWTWTPPAPGTYTLSFRQGGRDVASVEVVVPARAG
ncbi:MAG TPA: peptidylprolyl isomerase [Candidatus Thermoplasmatota archaeon]|nr:peptidylprolyl isomerase [Candidatus Thermoplasmatota archaeon]